MDAGTSASPMDDNAGGLSVTTLLLSAIIPLAVTYYALYRYRNRRIYELAEKIHGPKGLPFIGNMLDMTGPSPNIFSTVYKYNGVYQDVLKMWIGPRLILFIYHPDDVELILSSNEHIDKSPEYRLFEPWLGDGLLISSGEKWRMHRKLIAPTFHLNVLKTFFNLFNENSRLTVDRFRKLGGKEFDCHDFLSEATAEILMETVMGVKKNKSENAFDYAMAVMKMCDILHIRHSKFWMRPELVFILSGYADLQKKLLNTIHSLTRKVLKVRKENHEENMKAFDEQIWGKGNAKEKKEPEVIKKETASDKDKYSFGQSAGLKDDLDVDDDVGEKKRLAFLDLLIQSAQNGVLLTDEEIQNQVDTIMFEGHDTTASGSSFFMSMMAAHQDIQDKVIAELDSIFGDSDRDITFQDTLEMKYLERCIMETLRMYPPVPIIARQLKKEVQLKSNPNIILPANVTVTIATIALHRREDIYKDPMVFNPDNFLPDNSSNRHYYSYIPFSAGPRSCVGRKYAMLKLKVLLGTILRNFRVLPGMPEKDWKLQADIILKRADGFPIKLQPRAHVANYMSSAAAS